MSSIPADVSMGEEARISNEEDPPGLGSPGSAVSFLPNPGDDPDSRLWREALDDSPPCLSCEEGCSELLGGTNIGEI
jgi:hypothetical protein